MKINVFTAFSGYDAQCMALDRLKKEYPLFDYELVGWSEIDKAAIASHNAVYPQWADRNYGDISKVNWELVPDFNLFTYSFPCIDYSICGNMRGGEEGSGTCSSLLWECKKAIEKKRPKFCVLENVKNMTSKTFIKQFIKWERTLVQLGYQNSWQVLNSGNYNNCQNRERVFMISVRKDDGELPLYHFPKRVKNKNNVIDYIDTNVEHKYYYTEDETRLFIDTIGASKLTVARSLGQSEKRVAAPLTVNGLVPTLMATGYEGATYKNMINLSYYPKLGVLDFFS